MEKSKNIGVIFILGIVLVVISMTFFFTNNMNKGNRKNSNNSSQLDNGKVKTYEDEVMEQVKNNDKLTDEDRANAKVYASHLKTQFTLDRVDFMMSLKPRSSSDNIIENDMKTLIAYLNVDFKDYDYIDNYGLSPCYILSILYPYGYDSDKDVNSFNNMYPAIAECLYNFRYVEVKDDSISSRKLISNEDYNELKKYFTGVEELKVYDTLWEDEVSAVAKPYLEKNYRVAYEFGDGFGFSERFFELDSINKVSDNKYNVQISMYYHNGDAKASCEYCKKVGKFEAEVVNNYIKFGKLVFE